jgi:hypothetical protein
MAAIIDNQLAMSALNDALVKSPHPEIFNTDQGSQHTSEAHIQRLKTRYYYIHGWQGTSHR